MKVTPEAVVSVLLAGFDLSVDGIRPGMIKVAAAMLEDRNLADAELTPAAAWLVADEVAKALGIALFEILQERKAARDG